MTVRLPIPHTPADLLAMAARLDRFWRFVEAGGGIKPSLDEECALRERQNETGRTSSS